MIWVRVPIIHFFVFVFLFSPFFSLVFFLSPFFLFFFHFSLLLIVTFSSFFHPFISFFTVYHPYFPSLPLPFFKPFFQPFFFTLFTLCTTFSTLFTSLYPFSTFSRRVWVQIARFTKRCCRALCLFALRFFFYSPFFRVVGWVCVLRSACVFSGCMPPPHSLDALRH